MALRTLIAVIDAARCIGCARCLDACPVDAIVGSSKRMHDVVAELCTGCELCVPPCPVDCIAMRAPQPGEPWLDADLRAAEQRHEARLVRIAARPARANPQPTADSRRSSAERRAIIAAALERSRARQRARGRGR
jgi:electron transport complex protein RnfB